MEVIFLKLKRYYIAFFILSFVLTGCSHKEDEKAFEIVKYEDRIIKDTTFDDLVLEMMEANPEDRDFSVTLSDEDLLLPDEALWLKEFEIKVLRKEPISKDEYLEYFDRYAFYYDTLDTEDSDDDGLPNWLEEKYHTNPFERDTDEDGLLDGYEVFSSMTNPLEKDSDNNGVDDGDEDYDKDGLTNIEEQFFGSEAFIYDTDNDGLNDYEESIWLTDPNKQDTDEDGIYDGIEVFVTETNPLKVTSKKDGIKDGDKTFEVNYVCAYKDGEWKSTIFKQSMLNKIEVPENEGEFIAIVHTEQLGQNISKMSIEAESMINKSFTAGAISPFFLLRSENKEKIEVSIELLYKETKEASALYFSDLTNERSWPIKTTSDKKGHLKTEPFEMDLSHYFYLKDFDKEVEKWNNW